MAALNESSVVKRFHNVSATQDSIQSLSLWVIHHKANHERIVELWFKVLKKAKIPHRLTMLYLCNDIVQTCKRKHAIIYKDAFKEILKDTVLLVRDSSIRKNVERIFTIWEERKVYDAEFIAELKAGLDQAQPAATLNSRLLAEFQPSAVVSKLRSYTTLEKEGEIKRSQLNLTRMDALNIEAVKQLKDRAHGKEFSQQFEDACVKLEDYIQHVEKEIKEGQNVIELLEQGELFYDAQYGEAKIVANAYKNFGTRVSNLKRKLEEHTKTLPSPIPSPTQEAPSPGNTPPKLRETLDNVEAIDMELSDDEDNGIFGEGRRRDSTITTGSYMQPIASVTEILMKQKITDKPYSMTDSPKSVDSVPSPKGSPIGMSPTKSGIPAYASFLNDAGASFLANAKHFSLSDSPKPIPTLGSLNKRGLEDFLAGGDSTPVRDENTEEEGRGGTPVMDEALESTDTSQTLIPSSVPPPQSSLSMPLQLPSHIPPPQMIPPPPQLQHPPPAQEDDGADNPMEFLTQLIIHHQAQKKGNKESKNDFLQSLSDMAQPKANDNKTNTSESWGSWKEPQHTSPQVSMSMPVMTPPSAPPTSIGHMPMPTPPPPPPRMPMPPRPPVSFSYPGSQSLTTPPVQSSQRVPLTPPSPQGPPRMPAPFPGPPPPRPPPFNNGLNPWRAPPPPPPPANSAPVSQGYDSSPNFSSQNFNSQTSQGFNTQNSSYSSQSSQGYNPSDFDSQGYERRSDYQEFEEEKPEYEDNNEYEQSGPRGPRFARPNHNNLTTIQTQDFGGDEHDKKGPSLGPAGGMPRPPPPPFPPGMAMRGLPPPQMPISKSGQDDQEEFRAKLKRKTSVSSPTTPGGKVRNLTEIPTGACDMDIEEANEEPEQDGLGSPIHSLAGVPVQPINQRQGMGGEPRSALKSIVSPVNKVPVHSMVHRPRMPPPPHYDGSPYRGQFDHRDSYARRDMYHEPFRRDPFFREGYGRPKRMPPPMRGGHYPRY